MKSLGRLLILLCLFPTPSRGAESSFHSAHPPSFETPIGLGAWAGIDTHSNTYGATVEGQNHFTQRRGAYGLKQYGQGESRLEIGNSVGIALNATSGVTLFGLTSGQRIAPHVGFEPLSARVLAHSHSDRMSYYEWLPMISLGPQVAISNTCRWLPLIRGGGGIGNFGKVGWAPSARISYGVGSYLNCSRWDAAMEITRLGFGGTSSDLATADLSFGIGMDPIKIGVRFESDLARTPADGSRDEKSEQRVLLLLRGRLASFD